MRLILQVLPDQVLSALGGVDESQDAETFAIWCPALPVEAEPKVTPFPEDSQDLSAHDTGGIEIAHGESNLPAGASNGYDEAWTTGPQRADSLMSIRVGEA